ncbi:MAG: hypothetical protein GY737_23325 [Desulfobacteraceae bacterium]|nr:hypothetical protein [Desulfobacteraceae bacterium]
MEATKNFSQMVDFQQVMFNNTFNMMKTFQSQGEAWMNLSMDQNPWLPEDGKKMCSYWNETCQKSLDDYKNFVDTSFSKAREMFGPPAKPAKK